MPAGGEAGAVAGAGAGAGGKLCRVCGDRALGYNFNAVSCESCKAFFRRNAVSERPFQCPFADACEITAITRRFCQKCRLAKCYAVGMSKEYIMTEQDKAEKRRKIAENRSRKRPGRSSGDGLVTSSKRLKREDDPYDTCKGSPAESFLQYDVLSTTCGPADDTHSPFAQDSDSQTRSPYPQYQSPEEHKPIPSPVQFEAPEDRAVSESASWESRQRYAPETQTECTIRGILTSHIRNLTSNVIPHVCEDVPSTSNNDTNFNKAKDILEDVERIPIVPNSIESILCEAIKLEFEAYTSLSHGNRSSRELNEVERAKLNELIVANKALHAPIDTDISMLFGDVTADFKDSKHDPTLVYLINLTAVAIRRLIKMAKKINAFKNMCEEDQVALLKGGCIEMMVLRSTITYDCTKNSWKIPQLEEKLSSIKTDVLKLAKGNIYHGYENFIRTFDPKWRTDENIILIMSAICLFSANRPKVVHNDVIKLEQNSYYYLLRRYLESVYPGCEAKSIFLKLIQKIMELNRIADEVIGVYLDVNPIEPLLMEIFDLKQHTTL